MSNSPENEKILKEVEATFAAGKNIHYIMGGYITDNCIIYLASKGYTAEFMLRGSANTEKNKFYQVTRTPKT